MIGQGHLLAAEGASTTGHHEVGEDDDNHEDSAGSDADPTMVVIVHDFVDPFANQGKPE